MYYFLKKDLETLNAEIGKIADRIKDIGKEMGKSCQEGAETFHDNFAHEDGERQQYMWSSRLRELIRIRNQAHIVEPQKSDRISLGITAIVKDIDTEETRTIKIGSYMIFAEQDKKTVSYNAPIARMLIHGKVGEIREAIIAGKKKCFLILKIEE